MKKLIHRGFLMRVISAVVLITLLVSACAPAGNSDADVDDGNDKGDISMDTVFTNITEETEITDGNAPRTADGKTQIVCAWDTLLNTLSPVQQNTSPKQTIQYSVIESFMTMDSNSVLHPTVAKSYTMADEEGYRWSIELYDYVYDSDGNHITADDAVFCVQETAKASIATAHSDQIVDVQKTGDFTIEVEFSTNAYGVVESFLAFAPVFSQKAYEETGDSMATKCVGTGPYKVVDFVSGASLTLEAVDNYWQTDESLRAPFAKQNVDIIKYVFITENSQREVLLETGDVNMVYNIDVSSLTQFAGNDDMLYQARPAHMIYNLIPTARGVFADKRVRQALAYAIDEQALIDAAYDGYGFKTNHGLSYTTDYNHAWDQEDYYPYNPEKARELIKEAGAEGAHVILQTTASAGSVPEYVLGYLNEVGLDCEIRMLELAAYNTNYKQWETYDLTTAGVSRTSTVEYYTSMYIADENGTMMLGFNDPTLKEMLDTAGSPKGHTEENMDALHDYLVDECYVYTPITFCQVNMWRSDGALVDTALNYNVAPMLGACTYVWNS